MTLFRNAFATPVLTLVPVCAAAVWYGLGGCGGSGLDMVDYLTFPAEEAAAWAEAYLAPYLAASAAAACPFVAAYLAVAACPAIAAFAVASSHRPSGHLAAVLRAAVAAAFASAAEAAAFAAWASAVAG